jgi:hypothetical protein
VFVCHPFWLVAVEECQLMYLQDWNFSWSPACNLLPIVTVSKYVVQNYLNEALRLQVFVN